MQAQLMVMRGEDKQGQRVWAVQSASQSAAQRMPVFHVVRWDASQARWVCPCPAYKPCVHIRLASAASKAEQQQADAAFDALTGPYPDYDDSNPRREEMEVMMRGEQLTVRNTPPMSIYRTVLPLLERVREVM